MHSLQMTTFPINVAGLIEFLHGRFTCAAGTVQNRVFYQTRIFGIFSLAGINIAFSKREFPVALRLISQNDFRL